MNEHGRPFQHEKTAYNSTYPKGWVLSSKESFVFNQILVFKIKFCGNMKLLPNVMFRLFKELWFASSDCSHPIENMGIRLLEVAKSTNTTKDYVREYLNELVKQGHVEMTSEKPLLFTITDMGKKVKTIKDIAQLCAAANL